MNKGWENFDLQWQTYTGWDALALPDEMGARREVSEMCWALSQLEIERGNKSVAVQLKERALHEALWIAEHAGTPELREFFLSRPDVRLILGTL